MPLSDAFPSNNPRPSKGPPPKRPPPFSLRLSEAERAHLTAQANGAPLAAYVKAKLFENASLPRKTRAGRTIQDRQAFAQALALLGKSDLAKNVASLARAAEIGALPVDPDTEAKLLIVCDHVRHIRAMLMVGLGLSSQQVHPPADALGDL